MQLFQMKLSTLFAPVLMAQDYDYEFERSSFFGTPKKLGRQSQPKPNANCCSSLKVKIIQNLGDIDFW